MNRPSSVKEFERLALALFNHDLISCPYGAADFYLRLAVFMLDLQVFFTHEREERRETLVDDVESLLEQYGYTSIDHPEVLAYLREMHWWLREPRAGRDVEREAWDGVEVSGYVQGVPGMMYDETLQYYKWLGQQYTGRGELVELGCWLGQSTCAVGEGMQANPNARGRQIQVFDSFVRAGWMTPFGSALDGIGAPEAGDSFLPAFLRHTAPYAPFIRHAAGWIGAPPPGGAALAWNGAPIETLIYDLAHDYDLLDAAWRLFAPSFLPGLTTIAVNIYGNARACGIRRFIHERGRALRPVHKPRSSVKAFRFEG